MYLKATIRAIFMIIVLIIAGCAEPLTPNPKIVYPVPRHYRDAWQSSGYQYARPTSVLQTPPGTLLSYASGGKLNSPRALIARIQNRGAQVLQIGDTISILIPSDKLFAPSEDLFKHEVYSDFHPTLNLIAKLLNLYGNSAVKIAASLDDVQNRPRSYLLAKRQANRVASYLYKQGVSAWRLYPLSYGPDNLLATNRTVLGSYYNRVIEITFNPYVTPADCCSHIAHFIAKKQPWQFWGLPY